MEFGILGPLRVTGRDGPIRVPGGRQGELLALLVIGAGRSLPAERLVDLLWGEQLPANPANALQQHVFGLRRLLDPAGRGEVLLTRDGGYQLAVSDEAVDARRFEQLVRAGEAAAADGTPAEAARTLTEALELWRGDALQGLDRPWARTEAGRLEELRLVASEERIAAGLALGRHAGLVAELEALVAAHPLRERLRGQLMVALAGSGRQADALQVYTDTRELLAEELGVDPSRQLQAIHADVLAQRIAVASTDLAAVVPDVPSAGEVDGMPDADQASAVQDPPSPDAGRPRPLPVPPGRFLGRDEELERVTRLLEEERLLTLTGPGGAGKTRLAIEVARGLRDGTDPREVHLVELAPVTDPDAVASTLAAALGVADHRGIRPTGAVLAAFEERRALVVLDNVEQVVAAVAALAEQVVAACPAVQLLVTSREPLGVTGEMVWPVPPLAVPPATTAGRPLSAGEVERHAAVQLFLDRVRAVAPDLEMTATDLDGVARIVRDLDGLPLAIELAAARSRVLSVPEIADRLHDRLALLAGGRRAGPARHRTLRDTLDWSYEPLTDDERRAFEAAAVPVAPFTTGLLAPLLEAAGCQLDELDAVTMLCDRSLLAVHERGAPSRYRMLETLREFAVAKLTERGCEPAVRDAHAEVVEAAVLAVDRTTPARWDVDIDEQRRWLPEARAALRWRSDRGDPRGVQRLAAGLGWLWLLAALAPEGLRWLTAGLGPIASIDLEDVEPGAVLWASFLRLNEAPEDDGLRWAQLAVDAADEPVLRAIADALVWIYRSMEGGPAAVADDVPREEARDGAEGWPEGLGRLGHAQMLALTGDAERGSRALAEAERLLVDNGAWFGIWANVALAYLQQLRGDRAAVEGVVERGLVVSEQRDLPELAIELRCTRAMVQAAAGEHEAADLDLAEAEAHAARTGVAMSRSLVATSRGYLAWCRGELQAAIRHLEAALELHDRLGNHFGTPFVQWVLGCCRLDCGQVVAAAESHHAAYRSARERGEGDVITTALEGLAAVCVTLASDDPEPAAGSPPSAASVAAVGAAVQGWRLAGRLHRAAGHRRHELRATAPLLTRAVIGQVEAALASRPPATDEVPADHLGQSGVDLDTLVDDAVHLVRDVAPRREAPSC
ncbi:MAG: helix-turn-helix domain-containing protein [Nitriliruptor sp.]|nr:MAG: helix-turn-helix domain-containing protein [Nitriliruptor sp.]